MAAKILEFRKAPIDLKAPAPAVRPKCCGSCLWSGCECRKMSMYKPEGDRCAAYTYCD